MNARNQHISVNGGEFDYLTFGSGDEVLIMLPGVGDGFKTAKGMAVPYSMAYKCFAKDYEVFVFSRRNNLNEGFSTYNMAEDINALMNVIGIDEAIVLGVAQGGMIAQQLAINHPDKVKKLVLAVTAARPNKLLEESVKTWLSMARNEDYKAIVRDTAERSYSGEYLNKAKNINSMLSIIKPKDFTRFKLLCKSCLRHNVYNELNKIICPTLVVAADQDGIVGCEASRELAERIPGCTLHIYEGFGHGVYEQAKDFNTNIIEWLNKPSVKSAVRRANVNDIPRLMDLLLQVETLHYFARPDLFRSPTTKYSQKELEQIIADEETPVFVSVDENDVVMGHAFCVHARSMGDPVLADVRSLYIDDICVDEKSRGNGVGKSLYNYVLQYARENGFYNVTLNVWSCNPNAMKFYESMGLKPQKVGMEVVL